jgi:hypothetical protein
MFRRSRLPPAVFFYLFGCPFAPVLSAAAAESPFPPQLEVAVSFEPTAFVADGKQRLVYELSLRNFEGGAVDVQELAVLDGDNTGRPPLFVFDAARLQGLMRPIGGGSVEAMPVTTVASGKSALIYLLLTLEPNQSVPAHLRHRLRTAGGEVFGGSVGTHHDDVLVLSSPLRGNGWLAETGLSNDNGHRRGSIVLQGRSVISRRYAFDWIKMDHGVIFEGDQQDNASYFGYGQPVFAVADAVVGAINDGVAQNTPGRAPAVPMTYATIGGNSIQLDLGDGQYAWYMHLQPGSLRVKPGDRVTRGQVLGVIGNTGSSFVPHLHFEVTNSPIILAGEGLPYLFESFDVTESHGGAPTRHNRELPLEKMVVDFLQ